MQQTKAAKVADFQRLNDLDWQLFPSRVEDMNTAFERPVNALPTIHPEGAKRMRQFIAMLAGPEFLDNVAEAKAAGKHVKCELAEALEIIDLLDQYERNPIMNEHLFIQAMAKFADLLGDFMVYTMSEAIQWGIPLGNTLNHIMESQESKLLNGRPVPGDMPGKFGKGPNYKAPDEAIHNLILNAMQLKKMTEITVKG